ncbi:MAG: hypothetical protein MHM6MM_009275, partial [Cercozoa sp. M6MM]
MLLSTNVFDAVALNLRGGGVYCPNRLDYMRLLAFALQRADVRQRVPLYAHTRDRLLGVLVAQLACNALDKDERRAHFEGDCAVLALLLRAPVHSAPSPSSSPASPPTSSPASCTGLTRAQQAALVRHLVSLWQAQDRRRDRGVTVRMRGALLQVVQSLLGTALSHTRCARGACLFMRAFRDVTAQLRLLSDTCALDHVVATCPSLLAALCLVDAETLSTQTQTLQTRRIVRRLHLLTQVDARRLPRHVLNQMGDDDDGGRSLEAAGADHRDEEVCAAPAVHAELCHVL